MADDRHYVGGDFYRIDDRTGFKTRAGKTAKEWTGRIVRTESWDPRHPQDFVRGVRDDQTVPDPRPRQKNVFIGTQPCFFVYYDPAYGKYFVVEPSHGPGVYGTPSLGDANIECLPGNQNAEATIPVSPVVPIIHSAIFTFTLPVLSIGQVFGTITATNNPLRFTIVSGNDQGFYALDNLGALSFATRDVVFGSYALVITAANSMGVGPPGTALITIKPVPTPPPPPPGTGPKLMDSQYVPSLG